MVKLPTRQDLGGLPRVGSQGIARVNAPSFRAATPNIQLPSNAAIPQTNMPDLASGVANVARLSAQSGESAARGIADFGKGLLQVEANIAKAQEQDDALDVIKAKAYRDKHYMEMERGFAEDPDYQTFPDRFRERAAQIDAESLALIRNPDLQEEWGVRFGAAQEESNHRVLGVASKKKDAQQFLDLNTSLEAHREVYLDPNATDEQKQDAVESMQMGILAAQRAGVITPNQAVLFHEQYIKGVAKEDAEILLANDPDALNDELNGVGSFRRRLAGRESGGDPTIVNELGYAGRYQLGAPRLVDIGLYRPGRGEKVRGGKWTGRKWTGEFNIPGFPEVKSLEDFLANPEAQEVAFNAHTQKMDQEIAENGFEDFIGTSVGGVNITREGLYAMLHLGGVGSTKAALNSDGAINPADDNGTTVLDYAAFAGRTARFANLDPVDRASYKLKATQGSLFNGLLVDISDGTAGPLEIEKARNEGWLTDYDDIQKAYGAVNAREKQNLVDRAKADVADEFKVWDPTDTDNKKKLDALFEAGGGAQKLMGKDEEYLGNVSAIFERTGILPPSIKGTFQAMTRSSDVETVTWALEAMDTLEQENPEAFSRDMGEDAVRKVVRYREQLAYRSPEEIVEEMRRSEDPSRVEARKNATTEGRKLAEDVSDGDITDHFDLDFFYSEPDFPSEPLTAREMRADFDRLFAEEYAATGNEDVAKKSALKLLEGVWGTTDSTGTRQLMKYPPERYYKVPGLEPTWMTEQAEMDLAPYRQNGEAFTFRADSVTEEQIARKEAPTYLVIVQKDDGTFEPLFNPESGKLLRMQFDPKPYIEKHKIEREKKREEFAKKHVSEVDLRNVSDMGTPEDAVSTINPMIPGP